MNFIYPENQEEDASSCIVLEIWVTDSLQIPKLYQS